MSGTKIDGEKRISIPLGLAVTALVFVGSGGWALAAAVNGFKAEIVGVKNELAGIRAQLPATISVTDLERYSGRLGESLRNAGVQAVPPNVSDVIRDRPPTSNY